jgi:regulator of sigma E protease
MGTILHVIAILFGITLLIGVHELGHFMIARRVGIKVLRFSIGFGKPLWRKITASGLEIVIAAIPLGGYVRMLDEREGPVAAHELAKAFNRQSLLKRAAVILAGPVINFILAFFIYWLCYTIGITQLKPIIGSITPNSIASQANLPINSTITKIDNSRVYNWTDVIITLFNHIGSKQALSLQITHLDKQALYSLEVKDWTLDPLRPDPLQSLGIVPKVFNRAELKDNAEIYIQQQRYPLSQSWIAAWQKTYDYLKFNFLITYQLLTGNISLKSLTGPIGIFNGLNLAVKQGLASYLQMLAILSIAIGFINLFPIPGLDGGHLLFLLIERLRGKSLSVAVEVLAFRLGVIILAMLMVQAITNDLLRTTIS